jgi:bifunctional non-homologous end joining protein LigD
MRLATIACAADRIKAKSFTIDGEAVVLGPDGLSRFEELSRREAAGTAILYALDLIEHDGEDLRNLPFLDRKAALARLSRIPKLASYSTNTSRKTALPSSRTLADLAPKASSPSA